MSKMTNSKSDVKRKDNDQTFVKNRGGFHPDDLPPEEGSLLNRSHSAPPPQGGRGAGSTKREAALDLDERKKAFSLESTATLHELADRHGIPQHEEMSREALLSRLAEKAEEAASRAATR
jgi:hypothetical protein